MWLLFRLLNKAGPPNAEPGLLRSESVPRPLSELDELTGAGSCVIPDIVAVLLAPILLQVLRFSRRLSGCCCKTWLLLTLVPETMSVSSAGRLAGLVIALFSNRIVWPLK